MDSMATITKSGIHIHTYPRTLKTTNVIPKSVLCLMVYGSNNPTQLPRDSKLSKKDLELLNTNNTCKNKSLLNNSTSNDDDECLPMVRLAIIDYNNKLNMWSLPKKDTFNQLKHINQCVEWNLIINNKCIKPIRYAYIFNSSNDGTVHKLPMFLNIINNPIENTVSYS